MKPLRSLYTKLLFAWTALLLGLFLAYAATLCLVSVRVGLDNLQHPGAWLPITAGASLLALILSGYCFLLSKIHRRLTDEHSLRL